MGLSLPHKEALHAAWQRLGAVVSYVSRAFGLDCRAASAQPLHTILSSVSTAIASLESS